ncbi:MAG: hypothetical protein J6Y32_04280 [Bacteroidales bacterium]|nr:hypothetical protein [Bacteroidales bacterium]
MKKDRWITVAFVVAILILSLLARIQLLPLESGDWKYCVAVWMERIQELGPWKSLSIHISDYSASYMYLMCMLSGFGNSLYAIKGANIVFDYAAAFVVFLLVRQLTGNSRKGIAALALTLLCPTVIINGSWWANCDIIYCFFLLLSLLFLFKDKGALCCVMMGIAFSFKQQSLFLLPFLAILCVKGKALKLWHFLWIPAVFFLAQIPAWIAGRPLGELLGIYFLQAGEFPYCTLHFPNFYEFLDENTLHWHHMEAISAVGLCFAFGVLGVLAWIVCTRKFKMTPEIFITLAMLSVSLALFTLPHMHERYGFLVDLLAIIYAVQRPQKAPLALGYLLISLLSYIPFLNGTYVIPMIYLALAMLGLNILLARDLARQISTSDPD